MAFASDAADKGGGGPWLSEVGTRGLELAPILKAPAMLPPLEPLAPEMAEQTEPAVITPAMLEEEEQLEAAGLEKERKMLEEVLLVAGGSPRLPHPTPTPGLPASPTCSAFP